MMSSVKNTGVRAPVSECVRCGRVTRSLCGECGWLKGLVNSPHGAQLPSRPGPRPEPDLSAVPASSLLRYTTRAVIFIALAGFFSGVALGSAWGAG